MPSPWDWRTAGKRIVTHPQKTRARRVRRAVTRCDLRSGREQAIAPGLRFAGPTALADSGDGDGAYEVYLTGRVAGITPVVPDAVPQPVTVFLLGAGVAGVIARRRG